MLKKLLDSRVFWGLTGLAYLLVRFPPWKQAYFVDAAYLMYLSQTVARGEPLYTVTNAGYTPLAFIINGLMINLFGQIGWSSFFAAKLTGAAVFYLLCLFAYDTIRKVTTEPAFAALGTMCFIASATPAMYASTQAEPKVLVLLFIVLGYRSFTSKNWYWTAFWLTLAAMCWQLAIISLIAILPVCLFFDRMSRNVIKNFAFGITMAILPALAYVVYHGDAANFWHQGVLKKVAREGGSLGESPFRWLRIVLNPELSSPNVIVLVL